MSINTYIEAMPKVELHVHLEGSTQPETLLELADRNGVQLPANSVEGLRQLYTFRNFDDFLEIYLLIVKSLQTEQDFADIVYRFGAEMARQNIRYAEVTWTPQFYVKGDAQLPFEVVLDALNDGRRRAREEWGVEMRWIPDIVRNMPQYMNEVQTWCCKTFARDGGVVAMGLGGFEVGYPPEVFAEPFRRAREMGLPANPHAGETDGPASVWGAIRSLHAVRIGHGVRSIEDPALIQYLVEHQIPLEVNPTSNLCLQIYPSYAEHPLRQLLDAGCYVTINSDDPPLFNTTLTQEYQHAVHDCGLSVEELERTILNAIRASYLTGHEKDDLLATFKADLGQLRRVHDV